jgi:hypothetical protein
MLGRGRPRHFVVEHRCLDHIDFVPRSLHSRPALTHDWPEIWMTGVWMEASSFTRSVLAATE